MLGKSRAVRRSARTLAVVDNALRAYWGGRSARSPPADPEQDEAGQTAETPPCDGIVRASFPVSSLNAFGLWVHVMALLRVFLVRATVLAWRYNRDNVAGRRRAAGLVWRGEVGLAELNRAAFTRIEAINRPPRA